MIGTQSTQKTAKMVKVRQAMEEMAMGVIWTTVKTHTWVILVG